MSVELQEGNLKFNFNWDHVEVFDKDRQFYDQNMKSVSGTKAIDFLGYKNNVIYFIEVKDLRKAKEKTDRFQDISIKDDLKTLIGQLKEGNIKNAIFSKEVHDLFELKAKGNFIKEIPQKVRDTIAAITVGAYQQKITEYLYILDLIVKEEAEIKIIFWIESTTSVLPQNADEEEVLRKRLRGKKTWEQRFQSSFNWLTSPKNVSILYQNKPNLDLSVFDFTVTE